MFLPPNFGVKFILKNITVLFSLLDNIYLSHLCLVDVPTPKLWCEIYFHWALKNIYNQNNKNI